MLDLNLLRTFAAVADTARVSQAASTLGIPKSTVSRHIARLEEQAGALLFTRRSAGLELTGAGRRLFQKTRGPIAALNATLNTEAATTDNRPLVVHSPTILARGLLKEILAEYVAASPQSCLDIRLSDRFEIPDAQETDLVFLVGATASRDFEQWPIGHVKAHLYGAPSLFDGSTIPLQPSEIEPWPILLPTCEPGSQNTVQLFSRRLEATVILQSPRFITSEVDLLLEAACKGLGLLRMATFLAEPRVATGELVRVLPDWHVDRLALSVGRSAQRDHPAAAELADFVAKRLSHSVAGG